jgi:hypothetical protein
MAGIEIPKQLKPFMAHGVDFTGESGDNFQGYCPFCGKDKFYVNPENLLWNCHSGSCSLSGNLLTFLDMVQSSYQEGMSKKLWAKLHKSRGIPIKFLKKWGIGYEDGKYRLPYKNIRGHVQNIRSYGLKNKQMRNTMGASLSLYGMHQLENASRKHPVYLCEGEWDVIALDWFLRTHKKKGIVLGAPGANIFKEGWEDFFKDRRVYICYDNDAAGRKGLEKVSERLKRTAGKVYKLAWPSGIPDKYDVRDFILERQENNADTAWDDFRAMMKHISGDQRKPKKKLKPITFADFVKEFSTVFELNEDMIDTLKIIFGVYYANRLPGPPVWMFAVGPPGAGKTEIVQSLDGLGKEKVEFVSNLTSKTLLSGFNQGERDPSQLPKWNDKLVILKDYTEILTKNDAEKDEIVGTLRGAWDGRAEKHFGNGISRVYDNLRFGVIACVTPEIYADNSAAMGDRFLKWNMTRAASKRHDNAIYRVIHNVMEGIYERESIETAAARLCARDVLLEDLPRPTAEFQAKLVGLVQIMSRLRVEIRTDNNDRLTHRPDSEIGTRPALGLMRLGYGLVAALEKDSWDDEIWNLLERVAFSTSVGFNVDVFRTMVRALEDDEEYLTSREISQRTSINRNTLSNHLTTLELLDVITRTQIPGDGENAQAKFVFKLTDVITDLWKMATQPIKLGSAGSNGHHPKLKIPRLPKKKKASKKPTMKLKRIKRRKNV